MSDRHARRVYRWLWYGPRGLTSPKVGHLTALLVFAVAAGATALDTWLGRSTREPVS